MVIKAVSMRNKIYIKKGRESEEKSEKNQQ